MSESKIGCMGRREFLVKTTAASGGLLLFLSSSATTFASAKADVEITVDAKSPLSKVGGSIVVDTPAGKVIVIRTSDTTYSAFSAKCTHKGGIVDYDSDKKQLVCPKHSSTFSDKDGKPTGGPAETPLAIYGAAGTSTSVKVSIP
jgi:cytochrome b6-f complex iron-sulfur subunit